MPRSRTPSIRRHRPHRALALTAIAVAVLLAACGPRVVPAAGGAQSTTGATTGPTAGPTAGATAAPTGTRPSPGCAAIGSAAVPRPERLVVDGRERTFLARIPAGSTGAPRDLVLVFHGRTNDAAQVRRYVGLDAALAEAIVVYPRALPAGPGAFAWGDPGDPPDGLRDFALVGALIDAFGAAHCIDLERVFVIGHSLGGYFANAVACRMGDPIRAVATVAGGLQGDGCVGGAAALLVHHPDDRLVPASEGARARDAFRSANGLGAAPAVAIPDGPSAPLRCVRYGDAVAADPVVWCARDDASTPRGRDPHTWPTGAAAAIAAFIAGLP